MFENRLRYSADVYTGVNSGSGAAQIWQNVCNGVAVLATIAIAVLLIYGAVRNYSEGVKNKSSSTKSQVEHVWGAAIAYAITIGITQYLIPMATGITSFLFSSN